VGTWQGWSKFFLRRKRRIIGVDRSEQVYDLHHIEPTLAASDLAER
jgi:hypothetical protein